MSYTFIKTVYLPYGTAWDIVNQYLGYYWKLSSQCVHTQLTEKHKKILMATLLELLQCYVEHGEKFLCRIITRDKTWVFCCSPESKAESMT